MIKCRVAVLGESVVRDVSTNNISVFNILERVAAHKFPIAIPKVVALFMLTREGGDSEAPECLMGITISGEELNRYPINVNFQGKLLHRMIVEVGGLVIPKPGIMRTSIIIEGQEAGSWELEVAQIEKPKIQHVDQG